MEESCGARALVVDDDVSICALLATLLEREGWSVSLAHDAEAAMHRLLLESYELLLLDVNLPVANAPALLGLFERRRLVAPRTIALMSERRALEELDERWGGAVRFFEKPFGTDDVRRFLRDLQDSTPPRADGVLVTGHGLWADALLRVVARRGGATRRVRAGEDPVAAWRESKARVVVLGPPLPPREIVRSAVALRDEPFGGPVVYAALRPSASVLAADLRALGVSSFSVPTAQEMLGGAVLEAAGLPRRRSPRVPMVTPVLVRSGPRLLAALTKDLSAQGLGIECAGLELGTSLVELEMRLPASGEVIASTAKMAWSCETERPRRRIGLRFASLDDAASRAISGWIERYRGCRLAVGHPMPVEVGPRSG